MCRRSACWAFRAFEALRALRALWAFWGGLIKAKLGDLSPLILEALLELALHCVDVAVGDEETEAPGAHLVHFPVPEARDHAVLLRGHGDLAHHLLELLLLEDLGDAVLRDEPRVRRQITRADERAVDAGQRADLIDVLVGILRLDLNRDEGFLVATFREIPMMAFRSRAFMFPAFLL